MPMVGRAPDNERVLIAAGHAMLGITMAPVTAQWVERLARGEDLDAELDAARARAGSAASPAAPVTRRPRRARLARSRAPTPTSRCSATLVAADDRAALPRRARRAARPARSTTIAGHLLYGTAPGPLIACHYDTVWPAGIAATRPMTVRDGKRLRAGHGGHEGRHRGRDRGRRGARRGRARHVRWRLSLTPDEEIGNRGTRDGHRRSCRAPRRRVLVLECALPDGGVKTARKGTAEVRITVEGRAAHAGNDHADGANAVVEAAHVALRAAALHDPAARHGLRRRAARRRPPQRRARTGRELALDVRSFDPAAIEAVFTALRDAPVTVPGTRVMVEGEMHRPPMPRTPAIAGLYATARQVADDLGFALPEHAVGGGSEANLAAGAGAPVLDGLGPVGAGSHALDEYVVVASIVGAGGPAGRARRRLPSVTAQPRVRNETVLKCVISAIA